MDRHNDIINVSIGKFQDWHIMFISVILYFIRKILIIHIFYGNGRDMVVDQQFQTFLREAHVILRSVKRSDDELTFPKIPDDIRVLLPFKISSAQNSVVKAASSGNDAEILKQWIG